MNARRLALALVALAALVAGTYAGWRWFDRRTAPTIAADQPAVGASRVEAPEDERAPAGVRVRVQVLNTTTTRGLARRATMMLRDRGFDVVETGTIKPARDSTVVLDLGGHPEWAARVAKAMGGARIETRRDSSRYLDIAVLIGRAWRPPAEPFYP